jgi:hypothetical protein
MLTVFLALLLTSPLAPLFGAFIAVGMGTRQQGMIAEVKSSRLWLFCGAFWLLILWANIAHWNDDYRNTVAPLMGALTILSGGATWLSWLSWLDGRPKREASLAFMAVTLSATTALLAFSAALYWRAQFQRADWGWRGSVVLLLLGTLVREAAMAVDRRTTEAANHNE